MRSARFWVVVLLMSLSALLLHVRGDVDRVPQSRPLSEFPASIGTRTATDIPLDPETLQVLGKGDFMNRMYQSNLSPQPSPPRSASTATMDAGESVPVGLFIGYFPTQRTGQSIHSPQHCLPGAGWTFESSGVTEFADAAGKKYRVGDYLITNGSSTDEVLYWYQMHGRSIAGDYAAKLYTLADSIRYGRTDAALIRIITPVVPGEERQEARSRVVGFAEQIAPQLPEYVPN